MSGVSTYKTHLIQSDIQTALVNRIYIWATSLEAVDKFRICFDIVPVRSVSKVHLQLQGEHYDEPDKPAQTTYMVVHFHCSNSPHTSLDGEELGSSQIVHPPHPDGPITVAKAIQLMESHLGRYFLPDDDAISHYGWVLSHVKNFVDLGILQNVNLYTTLLSLVPKNKVYYIGTERHIRR